MTFVSTVKLNEKYFCVLLLYVRHVGGHQHGVSIQSSINLDETLFQITWELITEQM